MKAKYFVEKITLILVSYGKNPCTFTNLMLRSVFVKKSHHLNQIIIVHNKENKSYEKKETRYDTEILHLGRREEDGFYLRDYATHEALNYATGEYLILSDPDIIYSLNHFDKYYLDLYKKHNLNVIGVQHFNPAPYQNFPCVINMFLKKDTLPKKGWMENEPWESSRLIDNSIKKGVKFDPSMFLVHMKLKNKVKEFPVQNLARNLWDVGCNLWLWNKELKGKYITFLYKSDGCEYYADKTFSNFTVKLQPNEQPLLYHSRYSTTRKISGNNLNNLRNYLIKNMGKFLIKI